MASRSSSEDKPKRAPKQPQTYESEGEESAEEVAPPPRRRGQRPHRQQKQGGSGPLENLALDSVQNTAGGLVNGVTGTLGGVAGNAVQNQGKSDKGKSDTLRLRLDLNLDIEITLKAKIHGDLELALLYVYLLLVPLYVILPSPLPAAGFMYHIIMPTRVFYSASSSDLFCSPKKSFLVNG
jgi:hypothetical protein